MHPILTQFFQLFHHTGPLTRDRSSQLPLPPPLLGIFAKRAGLRGPNSLEMVLESHVEVKGVPSVDEANSDESAAAWGGGRGWARGAKRQRKRHILHPTAPPAGTGTQRRGAGNILSMSAAPTRSVKAAFKVLEVRAQLGVVAATLHPEESSR